MSDRDDWCTRTSEKGKITLACENILESEWMVTKDKFILSRKFPKVIKYRGF